jgi:TFIIH basal transcription factor complex TTD-A subunit
MPRATKGILVQCDPSIKAIIMKIDSETHDYVMEDLDEYTLLVSPKRLTALKARLELVRY